MNSIKEWWKSVKEDPNLSLNLCMLWICFGYYYKLLCLPIRFICLRLVFFVDVNHWIELFLYCPLLFFSLYHANRIVFRESKRDESEEFHNHLSHNLRKHIGAFMIGLNLYGMGIHASANPIEIYAREHDGMDYSSNTYRLIHGMDENLSHWIQFIPFFFVIGWYIINDKTGRFAGKYISVFMGVGHGVDRAVGVIEGNSWYFGIPMSLWLLFCCYWRWLKYKKNFSMCMDDYFFCHGIALGTTIPTCQILYLILFGGFVQPSEHKAAYYYQAIYTFAGTFVLLIINSIYRKYFAKSRPQQFSPLNNDVELTDESTL
eukprot:Phypoly_transcript_05891.p1 GENE.Phypoly_transcript_05891~~Phypoly_transcript_05891.p1  ORF type:complete len:317 (-),score=38.66 Phypoly_transcript_05891:417-1367(-)